MNMAWIIYPLCLLSRFFFFFPPFSLITDAGNHDLWFTAMDAIKVCNLSVLLLYVTLFLTLPVD